MGCCPLSSRSVLCFTLRDHTLTGAGTLPLLCGQQYKTRCELCIRDADLRSMRLSPPLLQSNTPRPADQDRQTQARELSRATSSGDRTTGCVCLLAVQLSSALLRIVCQKTDSAGPTFWGALASRRGPFALLNYFCPPCLCCQRCRVKSWKASVVLI